MQAEFKQPCCKCIESAKLFREFQKAAEKTLSGLKRLYKNSKRRKATARERAAAMKRHAKRQAKKISNLTVLAREQHGRLVAHAAKAKRNAEVSAAPVGRAQEKAAARAGATATKTLWDENVKLRAEIAQLRASGLRAPQACPQNTKGLQARRRTSTPVQSN